jgi:glycosyltransferase involved in cell wall biosynthesis
MAMKLAFVVSGKSPTTHPGGLGAYAFNTAKILVSMGYTVYVIGFSDRNEAVDHDGVRIVHVKTPFNSLVAFGLFLISPYLVRAMKAIVAEHPPEEVLVYGAGLWGKCGVDLRKHLLQKYRFPVRVYCGYFSTFQHDSWGQVLGAPVSDYGWSAHIFMRCVYLAARLVFRPIEHKMLKSCDRVVVHYDSTRNILTNEVLGLDATKIVKLPYYVDLYERDAQLPFKSDSNQDKGVPTITVLCRQDPRKGINSFLKAVKILADRGIKFRSLVVGGGVFLEKNRMLAKKLEIEKFVEFPGFVNSVESVLRSTDIYVLPSVEEGSGAISLLEAMKSGVAIVTTICDGIPEDFVNGETGILVPMNNAVAMANGLEKILLDGELRKRLAENVRVDYGQRFTLAKKNLGRQNVNSGSG